MWIFHPDCGFLSAVAKGSKDIQVRARRRKDLENFLRLPTPAIPATLPIIETAGPEADYRWRIELTKAQWAEAAKCLAEAVDYNNVKGQVTVMGDDELHHAMTTVWAVMRRLQPAPDEPDYESGIVPPGADEERGAQAAKRGDDRMPPKGYDRERRVAWCEGYDSVFPGYFPPRHPSVHPFVSTPKNGKCSSCGKARSNPIHKYFESAPKGKKS